jgi:hypothetical protein
MSSDRGESTFGYGRQESRTPTLPLSAFEAPFVEVLCFRRTIVLPPPPSILEPEEVNEVVAVATSWIEVRVVDQDGEPVPNIEYEIKLTDGGTRRGRTNPYGVVRFDGIAEGNCEFTLGVDEQVLL